MKGAPRLSHTREGLKTLPTTDDAVAEIKGSAFRGAFWKGWRKAQRSGRRENPYIHAARCAGFRRVWDRGFDCGQRDVREFSRRAPGELV